MNRRDVLAVLAGGSAAALASGPAAARAILPDARFPTARAYLREMVADDQFNGAVLKIVQRGKPDFAHVTGWLDGAHTKPMADDAICQMASMTKPITGIATLILIERGKLGLDEPVDRWLPEMANRRVLRTPGGPIDDTVPSPRPITVRDLLSFRCGYGSNGASGPFGAAQRAASAARDISGDAFLKALSAVPLQYAPGVTWLYDVPADLLGVLIARVAGQSFGDFAKANIFDPLGMVDTGFYVPPSKLARLATLPSAAPAMVPFTAPPPFEAGGHGLYSTGVDYLRFTRMLLGGGSLGKVRIVSASSIKGMATDTLTPPEHVDGSFVRRYPGRGFGQTVAVRTEALPIGPSIGAYNWAGATGVWFMVDPPRQTIIVAMVQHPGGAPPGTGMGQDAPAVRKSYVEQRAWNDALQLAVYRDLG